MNIVIRPATEADYDEVARVWTRSFFSNGFATAPFDETVAQLRGRIPEEVANGWHLYAADDGDVMAAMLAFRTRDNFLSQIFVAPEYQGRGVGKMLMAFTRQHLPDEILLRTDTRNARAIAWYTREGFVRENEEMQEGWSAPQVYFRWRRGAAPRPSTRSG